MTPYLCEISSATVQSQRSHKKDDSGAHLGCLSTEVVILQNFNKRRYLDSRR